ncbi:hypothetical protein SAMN05216327_12336 [Dyadobacter sp. SG02]|nr:hypothetical protein SAMN05216327_12336 [Dyadobacter sp. SG02]
MINNAGFGTYGAIEDVTIPDSGYHWKQASLEWPVSYNSSYLTCAGGIRVQS